MDCCYAARSQVLLPAFSLNSSFKMTSWFCCFSLLSCFSSRCRFNHVKNTKTSCCFTTSFVCIIFTIDKTNWSNHWTQKMSVATCKRILELTMACLLHVIRTFSSQTWSVSHDFAVFLPWFFVVDHETQGGNTGIPGASEHLQCHPSLWRSQEPRRSEGKMLGETTMKNPQTSSFKGLFISPFLFLGIHEKNHPSIIDRLGQVMFFPQPNWKKYKQVNSWIISP